MLLSSDDRVGVHKGVVVVVDVDVVEVVVGVVDCIDCIGGVDSIS